MYLNHCVRSYAALLIHSHSIKYLPALVLFWVLSAISAAAEPVTKIVIAYENKTQFPYYLGETSAILPAPGAAVDLVLLLQNEIPGIEIELHRYPWGRCIALLKAGEVDAIFNASFSDSRAEFSVYPRTPEGKLDVNRRLTTISYSWYALSSLEEGTIKNVAAPLGYSIVNTLRQDGYKVYEVPQSRSALHMLLAGHVNRAALQTVTGNQLLATDDTFQDIERLDPPLVVKPYFLLFSEQFYQQHGKLTETIWTELANLREQKLPSLVNNYLRQSDQ